MKGLELSERYYRELGAPSLERHFPELAERIAAGLCGEGSECFGYDDSYSTDHDFGPSFCLWLTDEDAKAYGTELADWYQTKLPGEFLGMPRRQMTAQGAGRVGVLRTSDFYFKFTGKPSGPETNLEWLRIPEHFLAQATNGKIYRDELGEFTAIREKLLAFYPEEVRKKKLAARSITMAQAGQYNYPRSINRRDPGAAFFALREFLQAAMSMAHLLEKKYMPYYKWAFRSFCDLTILSAHKESMQYMMEHPLEGQNTQRIENICISVKEEWMRQGLTTLDENFLEPQGWELFRQIQDPDLRRRSIQEG